jgi:hypothetical protein
MNFTPIELLAVLAGVSLRTVYRDAKAGLLRTQKIDGKTMIKADHAARYVEQRKAVAEALAHLGRSA